MRDQEASHKVCLGIISLLKPFSLLHLSSVSSYIPFVASVVLDIVLGNLTSLIHIERLLYIPRTSTSPEVDVRLQRGCDSSIISQHSSVGTMGFFSRSKKAPKEPEQVHSNQTQSSYNVSTQCQHNHDQLPPYQYPQHYGPPPPVPPAWQYHHPPPQPQQRPPIVIQNNYLLAPGPYRPRTPNGNSNIKQRSGLAGLASASMSNLANYLQQDVPSFVPGAQIFNNLPLARQGAQYIDESTALYDAISSKFDEVLTLLDGEDYHNQDAQGRMSTVNVQPWQTKQHSPPPQSEQRTRGNLQVGRHSNGRQNTSSHANQARTAVGSSILMSDLYRKTQLYSNSRVQGSLTKVQFYMSTFPLLCLAVQSSAAAYDPPTGLSRKQTIHIPPSRLSGTKAMIIKSAPVDQLDVLVFAIRGSKGIDDWRTNFANDPASPAGFIDDAGNLCHEGFLRCARKMVRPIAERLREMLQQDPKRAGCALLLTGHSAGGAVAQLLYMHMLSSLKSELTDLKGFFRHIHCVTFGAPPVSLLPLQKPTTKAMQKSLFLSFINEGDPVARADWAYLKCLMELYATPGPSPPKGIKVKPSGGDKKALKGILKGGKSASTLAVNRTRPTAGNRTNSAPSTSSVDARPVWPVPRGTLSSAGKIVLLRTSRKPPSKDPKKGGNGNGEERIEARLATDQQLRGCIFGLLMMHKMDVYRERIERMAVGAVTAHG